MKRVSVLLLCIFILLIACQTVPITGRRQLSLVSSDTLNSMSFKSYDEFISQHTVIKDTQEAQMVKRVGQRIQTAVTKYFDEQHMASHLDGYVWEFNLVEDPAVNAWCMPGGKVVVYSGILPAAQDEMGLAVVMGHEIAHAVANHGNERMSQGLVLQMGGIALATALSEKPKEAQALFMAAYGLGAQVGLMLPFSRLHESEADHLGLIFMTIAGYDPNAAIEFWQRMANVQEKSAPPQFLSTHPSDITRIQNIKKLIPEVLRSYGKKPSM